MVRAILLACLVIAAAAPGGLAQSHEDISSPKLRIGWAEFKKLYDARTIEVIDVRSETVFEAGHIPGSRSVPFADVDKRVEELKKLNKPLVLICA